MNIGRHPSPISGRRKGKRHLYWNLVQKSDRSVIHHQSVCHLKPSLLDRPKNYNHLLKGFKLLRKEPFNSNFRLFDNIDNKLEKIITGRFLHYSIDKNSCLHVPNQSKKHPFFLDFTTSLFFHGIIVLLIFVGSPYINHKNTNPYGNSSQGKPVDVVFLPRSTGQSGLKGEGYNGEPAPSKAISPPPIPDSLPIPPKIASVPKPDVNPSENKITVPQPDAEPIPSIKEKPRHKSRKIDLNKEHKYFYKNIPPRIKRKTAHPVRSQSPFENLTNLDFNENPNASHRRMAKIRPQGSRSAINMSTGPLVKNGKINTPYADKFTIKGVSSDYSDLIAAWIQQHMYYPPDAIRKGEDGSPSVHVVISRDGQVLSINLTNSSGSDALDAAILGMFRNAQLPKIPPDLPDHFDMDLKINYILLRQ